MAPNIYCWGAGTAAYTEFVNRYGQLSATDVSLCNWARIKNCFCPYPFKVSPFQGHVNAALVLGGVDVTEPHLHAVYPHGSTDTLPYATMGSGSLAAMAIFESKYKENLDVFR